MFVLINIVVIDRISPDCWSCGSSSPQSYDWHHPIYHIPCCLYIEYWLGWKLIDFCSILDKTKYSTVLKNQPKTSGFLWVLIVHHIHNVYIMYCKYIMAVVFFMFAISKMFDMLTKTSNVKIAKLKSWYSWKSDNSQYLQCYCKIWAAFMIMSFSTVSLHGIL